MVDLNRKGIYCVRCGMDFNGNKRKLAKHLEYKCTGRLDNIKLASEVDAPYDSFDDELFIEKTVDVHSKARHSIRKEISFLQKRKTCYSAELQKNLTDNQSDDNEPNTMDPDMADLYDYVGSETYQHNDEESLESIINEDVDSEPEQDDQHHDPNSTPDEKSKDPYTTNLGIASSDRFQIDLADILKKHRTDLSLHNEIITLIKKNTNGKKLSFSGDNLQKRAGFIDSLEKRFASVPMKPKDIDVDLSNGDQATVSVYDIEAMILSLLHDPELMKEENLVQDYDIFTGKPTKEVTHYGEIHTGDAWEPAREYYCGNQLGNMPIALIIFGDKSHFDKHGSLATTPLSFTLSCFNQNARNSADFWRPIAYIPNLKYGKIGKSDSAANVQDEHDCIEIALESLVQLTKRGGISTEVKGQPVVCKVWIHYIIGDTQGNNTFVGHYNSAAKIKSLYRDCTCPFHKGSDPNPTCVYITQQHVDNAREKSEKAKSKTDKKQAWKDISKHDIVNAWMDVGVPLSDIVYGIYRMVPPELLHTTSEGITEYIIADFGKTLISRKYVKNGSEIAEEIEHVHQMMHSSKKRNSERDLPPSASRTGLLKNTLVNAVERRGNLNLLLCMTYTDHIYNLLHPVLAKHGSSIEEMQDCLKLYLSMEEWFHDHNPKEQVKSSRDLIARVIKLVQKVFPRTDGHGWNLPKMHGLTKMQYYICLFGSGINFFGGPGECNHKRLVKDTGNNTQGRVDCFSSQVAIRYYESVLLDIAKKTSDRKAIERYELVQTTKSKKDKEDAPTGIFVLTVNDPTPEGNFTTYQCRWKKRTKKGPDVTYHIILSRL